MSVNINPTAASSRIVQRQRHATAPRPSSRAWLVAVVTACAAAALSAQQAWVQNYRQGVAAFQRKDYAAAEPLLERARQLEPNQARRKRFPGTASEPYFPDYYLVLIYAEGNRVPEALAAAKRLESVFGPGDSETREMLGAIDAARRRLEPAPKPSPTTTAPRPPAPEDPPPKPPGNVPSTPGGRGNPPETPKPPPAFEATLASAETALRDNDAPRVFDLLRQARTENAPASRVDALHQRAVNAAVAQGTRLLGENRFTGVERFLAALEQRNVQDARLRQLRTQLQVSRLERRVLKDLLEGRYEQVVTNTEPAFRTGLRSARLLYYSACANAALDLRAGTEGPRSQVARQQYTEAVKLGGPRAFVREQAYISERIRAAAAGR
jgi:tetratricopeptide (TPR) repeat protein